MGVGVFIFNLFFNSLVKYHFLKTLFGRYHHLTLPYRASVTTMANDICGP